MIRHLVDFSQDMATCLAVALVLVLPVIPGLIYNAWAQGGPNPQTVDRITTWITVICYLVLLIITVAVFYPNR
jgi:predicted Na+-dependent transporter